MYSLDFESGDGEGYSRYRPDPIPHYPPSTFQRTGTHTSTGGRERPLRSIASLPVLRTTNSNSNLSLRGRPRTPPSASAHGHGHSRPKASTLPLAPIHTSPRRPSRSHRDQSQPLHRQTSHRSFFSPTPTHPTPSNTTTFDPSSSTDDLSMNIAPFSEFSAGPSIRISREERERDMRTGRDVWDEPLFLSMDPFASSSSTSAAAAGGWGAASSSTGCPIITSSSTALSGSPTFTGEGEEGERGTGTLGKIRRKLSMKSLLRPSKSRLREVEEEDFGNFNFAESYHGDYGDEGRGGEEELGLNVDVDVDRSPSLTSSLTSSSEGSATASSPASRQMSTKDSLTLRWHTIQLRVAFFVYRKRQTISRKFSLDKLPGGRGRRGTEGEIARPVPVWVS